MTANYEGLSSADVEKSRAKHGPNYLQKEKTKGFFQKFIENLNDPIIKILLISLIVEVVFTFGKCNFFEIGGIVIAILIATTVSTASELGSERAFLKMQQDSRSQRVRVFRDGVLHEISSDDIVVGDIMLVSAGETVHADGAIIVGEIRVDQSALNGESKEVTKKKNLSSSDYDLSNTGVVFRGSIVSSGEAVVKVSRVGVSTYYGMVAKDVQTETRKSPLKIRLGELAAQISRIGYVMAAIVGIVYLWTTIVSANGYIWSAIVEDVRNIKFVISTLSHALTLMITVIVVAAPEGLPMMITVVLSANMKNMLRDGVLVKKLVGIETAGSMNILFTDKTGTLTTGKLQCDRFASIDGEYSNLSSLKKNSSLYTLLALSAVYNTDSQISGNNVVGGNSTDKAILDYFKKCNIDKETVIERTSFNSELKYSSVKLASGLEIVKGAPEVVIAKCTTQLKGGFVKEGINRSQIEHLYRSYAGDGSRVIAVGYSDGDGNGFTFASLIILKDKIRRGVREAVEGVKKAGVQIVMVTGDGKDTASAIALECGILSSKSCEGVITSRELEAMTDDEVKRMLPKLRVLARALPQDKTRLVKLAQELDFVVGMTGDGINDAPSLKLADVGFSMGNGADIAKGASDIVLLENSFLSINRTILYGRTIFKSIRKFIVFQLIMNITACGVSLLGQFLGIESPITIIQMLWVNIIMDTLGGLAFAGEAPLEYYMKEKPKKRTEPILNRDMLCQIFFDGGFTLTLCILFLKLDYFKRMFRFSNGELCFMTAFYALFIFAGIFNCFGARSERLNLLTNISKNKLFAIIMVLISIIQIAMIYYGGTVFRTVPLLPIELARVISISFCVIPFEIIRRTFFKLSKRKSA